MFKILLKKINKLEKCYETTPSVPFNSIRFFLTARHAFQCSYKI